LKEVTTHWQHLFRIVAAVSLAAVAANLRAEITANASSLQFAKLLDDAWEYGLENDPLFATDIGDHRHDDLLPKVSLAEEARSAAADREFLRRLSAIDRRELSASDQINYDIFGLSRREDIQEFEFQTYLMPVTDRWGFHVDFPELRRNLSFATVRDYENYIARLRGFGAYADGYMDLMREGVRQGITVPSVIMQKFNEPIEAQIVDDPEKSLLYEPLQKFPSNISGTDQERLRRAAKAAIAESVVPGYQRFLKFMEKEYVPNCRTTIAASALPHGRDYYRFCVHKFTTLDDMTPEQAHETGLAEVARIRGEMDKIILDLKFDGDFAAFIDYLRTDPKFYAKTPEELTKEASFILKRMDGQLPKFFGHLPRMPYGVREVPAYIAPQSVAAYYQSPAGDGSRAGFFYINTSNLQSRPLYTLQSLCLHEAVPGHHLQIALQHEIEGQPTFRKYSGFTAFTEGWALYAEHLGLEAGFYDDPYSDFGRLTMEAWRACRLVVDTGIHYMGWTREQAVDYMRANTAMSDHDIRSEVDRYIGWPGQALAYKTGEMKIRALRADAEKQLGERFDLRAFHDVVLASGGVPLPVLDSNVKQWIAAQLQDAGGRSANAKASSGTAN
jgi:uncharacterized protein (DUF885 family)